MIVRLVTADEVRAKMGLSTTVVAQVPAVEAAILSAHFRMESELSTKFDVGSIADVFMCDPSKGYVVPDGMFRLRLSRGFVRASPAIIIKSLTDPLGAEGTDVTAQCKVSAERGHVFVPEAVGTGLYIKVEYSFGFNYDPGSPSGQPVVLPSFTGEQPPDWLKEAVLSYAPASFYMGQPTNRKDASTKGVIDTSSAHSLAVIAPHNRNLSFGLMPVFSSP